MPDEIARVLSHWLETVIANEGNLSLQPAEVAISRNGNLHQAATNR